ncbi:hypothetical protein [Fusobacterium sp.]|uniref:hypothetical protein n=1 Tax=Fusobacterium sp. TaxID=68766 RepID=UPI002618CCB6|nr:hypothetical protein [Fusobacterium sp.]
METMKTTLTEDLRSDRARYLRNLEKSRNEKYYKMDTESVVSSYAIFFAYVGICLFYLYLFGKYLLTLV